MDAPFVLLVNPWIYDFAAYDLWAKPLGLLYVAAGLRKCGVRVRIWDAMSFAHDDTTGPSPTRRSYGTGKFRRERVEKPPVLRNTARAYFRYGAPPAALRRELRSMASDPPHAVLVTSVMTYWYPGVVEAVAVVRELFPRVPVVLGGIYASLCPDHARRCSGADYVMCGPGEDRLAELLDICGAPGRSSSDKAGLSEPPVPAFDLLPRVDYLCVLTSRGCPCRCSYCASNLLFPRFEARDPESVFQEIEAGVRRFGVRDVAFYDDALLLGGETRIGPLLDRLAGFPGPNLRLHSPNGVHAGAVTPSLACAMKQAGFVTVRLGYESADMDWHARTGGKLAPGDMEAAVDALRSAGFAPENIGVYVLMGLPHQTPEDLEESIRDVRKLGVRPYLAEYSPIPGTEMWGEALGTAAYDIEAEPLFHNNTLMPCASGGFTEDRIRKLKQSARQ